MRMLMVSKGLPKFQTLLVVFIEMYMVMENFLLLIQRKITPGIWPIYLDSVITQDSLSSSDCISLSTGKLGFISATHQT
jgi:hypothetical protein